MVADGCRAQQHYVQTRGGVGEELQAVSDQGAHEPVGETPHAMDISGQKGTRNTTKVESGGGVDKSRGRPMIALSISETRASRDPYRPP